MRTGGDETNGPGEQTCEITVSLQESIENTWETQRKYIGNVTGIHNDSQGSTKAHRDSQGLTMPHRDSQGLTRTHKDSQGLTRTGETNWTGGRDMRNHGVNRQNIENTSEAHREHIGGLTGTHEASQGLMRPHRDS